MLLNLRQPKKDIIDLRGFFLGHMVIFSPEKMLSQHFYLNITFHLAATIYGCILIFQFEGKSLPQLVLKICRGYFTPVSMKYSYELRTLVSQLFKTSPRDRPSINSILKKPFLEKQIKNFLPPEVSVCCGCRQSNKWENPSLVIFTLLFTLHMVVPFKVNV